ncbi:hypothetical protein SD70_13575 [Gordoniibacillus kamchatkensis]|uniref:HTH gntR-type domain-containing protein n=1 Tax=Gordoniibacillus kamchatkensis TaxID=1590651 RepID=A0ABR5AHC2_9BACL|nr:FCD domain-containing protein [Paenibacillus sp. VKM B-2647]KIL40439.1 hypothetical protein SD70_13575 [Paenibacillus sp. VKM B-2647]
MNPDGHESMQNTYFLKAASLAEQTAHHILDAICEGRLRQDQPFPSQGKLCEWLGVSRTVIREATQILASKGVLDVKHGKRIVIRPPSHEQITESVALTFRRKGVSVLDVLELRKAIEVEAAALAAERADAEDAKKMEQAIVHMENHLEDETGYVNADVAFHAALFAAARQPAFEMVLASLNEYMVESRKLSYRGIGPTRLALEAHKNILQAIANKDRKGAREAMRLHLEETERNLRDSGAVKPGDR